MKNSKRIKEGERIHIEPTSGHYGMNGEVVEVDGDGVLVKWEMGRVDFLWFGSVLYTDLKRGHRKEEEQQGHVATGGFWASGNSIQL